MTAYLKLLNSRSFVVSQCVCLLLTVAQTADGQNENLPPHHDFLLLITSFQDRIQFKNEMVPWFAKAQMKGKILWHAKDVNSMKFDLNLTYFNREVADPDAEAGLIKLKPFDATVSVFKEGETPLRIEIRTGKSEARESLFAQYRFAYVVVDMMLANTLQKDFVVSEDGSTTILNVATPDKVLTDAFGLVSQRYLRMFTSPKSLNASPCIKAGVIQGSNLSSFSDDRLNIKSVTRFFDNKIGVATRAVNLDATRKEEVEHRDYATIIDTLDHPDKFGSYSLYELTLSDAK